MVDKFGDLAMEAGVGFLGVADHRLVPARARSEWKRLRGKGIRFGMVPCILRSSLHVV